MPASDDGEADGEDTKRSKLPKFRHAKLEQRVLDVATVFANRTGDRLELPIARLLGARVATVLGHKVPENNVQNTLTQYGDERITPKLVERLSWQLAARVNELRAGPLLRLATPAGFGWHLLEFFEFVPTVKGKKDGYTATLFCRYGQLAGYRLVQWFSERNLARISYEALGFGRRLVYDADSPVWLLGLRAWTLMVEREGQLELTEWCNDSSSRKRNQRMLKLRLRFDADLDRVPDERTSEYSCTRNFDHYCSDCPIRSDQCEASIHCDPHAMPAAVDLQPGRSGTG